MLESKSVNDLNDSTRIRAHGSTAVSEAYWIWPTGRVKK